MSVCALCANKSWRKRVPLGLLKLITVFWFSEEEVMSWIRKSDIHFYLNVFTVFFATLRKVYCHDVASFSVLNKFCFNINFKQNYVFLRRQNWIKYKRKIKKLFKEYKRSLWYFQIFHFFLSPSFQLNVKLIIKYRMLINKKHYWD